MDGRGLVAVPDTPATDAVAVVRRGHWLTPLQVRASCASGTAPVLLTPAYRLRLFS